MIEGQTPRFVSAAEITRNFGMWQDRAGQGPLVVTHHGRPRCVLLSVDAWQAIAASRPLADPDERAAIENGLLAERMDAGFIALDAALRVRGVNTLGAMMLGHAREVLAGVALAEALPELAEGPVAAQIRRTLRTGEEARMTVPYRGGSLHAHIFAWPDGVAVTLRPMGEEDGAERIREATAALRLALATQGTIGVVELTVRGTIALADISFAAMAGFAPERLVGVRASDLLTIGTRMSMVEAVEKVLSGAGPAAIDARLLVNGGEDCSVRIGIAPLTEGYAIGGAVLVMAEGRASPD